MLALNSYGLRSPVRPPPNNNADAHRVMLPRLAVSGGGCPAAREIRSLGKLELLARRPEHPLYRTTTGFDYGRRLEMDDSGGAFSCPKHAKASGFTKGFIAGNFADSSLASLDKSKLRAEAWEHKVAERTKLMRLKHEELQQQLAVKQERRRHERDARRLELKARNQAARTIQRLVRGFLHRTALGAEQRRRDSLAAMVIQGALRTRLEIWQAKRELQSRRLHKLEVFAVTLQRASRDFLLRADAKREVDRRRELRIKIETERLAAEQLARDSAAGEIQRVMRDFVTRRKLQRQLSGASSVGSADRNAPSTPGGDGGRSGSRGRNGTRRTLANLVGVRRKREKSNPRLPIK